MEPHEQQKSTILIPLQVGLKQSLQMTQHYYISLITTHVINPGVNDNKEREAKLNAYS